MTPDTFFDSVFPRLKSLWEADSAEVYQFDNPRARTVIGNLDLLKGRRILDIGCNSGIYSLLAARHAEYVCGVDLSEKFIRMAQAAKVWFQEHLYDVSHVQFLQTPLEAIKPAEHSFDTILACNVLYHLTDYEIGLIEKLLVSCRSAFFQMRPRRQMAYERSKETFFFVSRNTRCGGLYTLGHAVEFLQQQGFHQFVIRGEENYWADEPFPIVVATRD